MSKALADFHDLLLPELPGCTVDLVNLHLREVARDFCLKTSAWRLPFDPVNLVAAKPTYDLEPSEPEAEVVRVTQLTINSELLWEETDREQQGATSVAPKYVRNEPPFTLSPDLLEITLMTDEVPNTSLAAGMQVVGAMKPSAGAARLPDFLRSQYSEAMRFGTLARLMRMAKKPWTDKALAADYLSDWHKALNFAAYQVQVGNTREHLRVKSWDSPRYRRNY